MINSVAPLLVISLFSQTLFAAPLNSTVEYYNVNRKQPGVIFKSIAQSQVDRKFIESDLKSITELPAIKINGKAVEFAAEGRKHRFEILNSKKYEYMIDGVLFTDRPAAPLADRMKIIKGSQQKMVGQIIRYFIPEAQGVALIATGVVGALAGLLGVTIYKDYKRHQPEGICETLKGQFDYTMERMNEGFVDRFIPRLEKSAEVRLNIEVENATTLFNNFNSECGGSASETPEHLQHCKELGSIYTCSADLTEKFLTTTKETKDKYQREGKKVDRWNAISGLEALKDSVRGFRQLQSRLQFTAPETPTGTDSSTSAQ